MKTLLQLLAPGDKFPSDLSHVSFGADGLSLGWAFFLWIALVALTVWAYRRFAFRISWPVRGALTALRVIWLSILVFMLVEPVLMVPIDQTVRRPFLVLLDCSQSIGLTDQRNTPEDKARAAIAAGVIAPDGGLKQSLPASDEKIAQTTRAQILNELATNTRLDLWPQIQKHADLQFYGFGRNLHEIGALAPKSGDNLTAEDCGAFFHNFAYDGTLTAIGDSLEDLLNQQRGQPMAGLLLITDGANNSGTSPLEAAAIAKDDGVPLYIYGLGVTSPQDIMIAGLTAPQVTNVKEKMLVTVRIRSQGMIGKKSSLQLKADGKIVDQQALEFRADGEQEVTLSYVPDTKGEVALEAFVPPLPEEVDKNNNTAATRVRVADEKLKVLLVEDEPRWDFQYLLAMLQRDRRITLKAVLLKGDDGLSKLPDSPFLDTLPTDKDALFTYDVIILGDVSPEDIGATRMKLLDEWVGKMGGGLIFLAGPHFDPSAYPGTPMEPLLPVETQTSPAASYDEPTHLKLTPTGENSPILTLSDDREKNLALWGGFPGVLWTAWVGQARPGAQVLLVDPTPARATHEGAMPVIALQSYGLGQTLYVGFNETYRWRAKAGEIYYTRIWGQVLQALAGLHAEGSSALTQLKTDRPHYLLGDRVKINARLFQSNFTPVADPEAPGTLTLTTAPAPGATASSGSQTSELRLQAVANRPGEFAGEMVARQAGSYSFSVVRDPSAVLKFEVEEPKIELSDIAMNEKLLRAMAYASGGKFLREEDLYHLPRWITSQSADTSDLKKIPLSFSPWLYGLMLLSGVIEWFWRRKLELK